MAEHEPSLVFREPEDELHRQLRQLQYLILRYPVASQALFAALVAEGRQYAATDEGARWAAALTRSPAIERARVVWDVSTLRMLEDDPNTIVPSALLDGFIRAVGVEELEPFLSRMFEDVLRGS